IKAFFPSEGNFYRPSRDHRKFRGADLVRKRVAFAAEAAADGGGNDADPARGYFQDLGQSAMEIVGCLGRCPDGELVVRAVKTDGAILLHRQMRVALVKIGVFKNMIRLSEGRLDIAEFDGKGFLNIGLPIPGMNSLAFFGRG